MEEVTVAVSQLEESNPLTLQETVTGMIGEHLDDTVQVIRTWLMEIDIAAGTAGNEQCPQDYGRRKAAVFLVAIGSEISSMIFRCLREDEIETITFEIARLETVEPDQKDAVLQEFHELIMAKRFVSTGGIDFARELLEKSFGSQKAIDILNRLTSSLQVRPFDFIRRTDPAHFLNFIQSEHPQTIALVLSYLEPSKASVILQNLPRSIRTEVARRIAIMGRTSPEVLCDVERVLEQKLSAISGDDCFAGGVESIVEILHLVDWASEKQIIETLENEDPELAEEIKRRMFVFEDIVMLSDRSIQRVLREVDSRELAMALISADPKVQEKIFKNISKPAGTMLKEDMLYIGSARVKAIEESRQKIISILRHLVDSGEIELEHQDVFERAADPKICFTFTDVISKMDIAAILEQIEYPVLVTALKLSPLWMYKKLSKSMPFLKRCKLWWDIRPRSVLFEDIENAREHITSTLSGVLEKPAAGDNDD